MKKVKNILIKLNLEGKGIVNFDDSDQKYMYNGTKHYKTMGGRFDNTNYAKKNFYNGDDELDLKWKVKISSNSLRHAIFEQDVKVQSPNIVHHPHLLNSFIASPASILRGYMFTTKGGETIKRKSPLTITDAEQTSSAISYIETFSRSGQKETDSETTDNSFYRKETIGDIEYESIGNIDLMQLQFISCDQVLDRYSFNPDFYEVYKQFLKSKLPNFNSDLGYYQMNGSVLEIPEYGFKLNDEDVNVLVKGLFERLLNLNIKRNGAYAKTNTLSYKLVYDPLEDTISNEEGWVTVNTKSDVDNLTFNVNEFYTLEDTEKSKEKREIIENELIRIKNVAKEEKAKKLVKKKEINDKKTK